MSVPLKRPRSRAEVLAHVFSRRFSILHNFHAHLTLLIGGQPSRSFSAELQVRQPRIPAFNWASQGWLGDHLAIRFAGSETYSPLNTAGVNRLGFSSCRAGSSSLAVCPLVVAPTEKTAEAI